MLTAYLAKKLTFARAGPGEEHAMANLEHVELIKQGTEAIRQWREGNRGVKLDLTVANLRGADLREAFLYGADLSRVQGVEHAYGLETVRFIPAEDTQASASRNDARYFETCHRPWPEGSLDWERLKIVGRLPLFGISYTALILIPLSSTAWRSTTTRLTWCVPGPRRPSPRPIIHCTSSPPPFGAPPSPSPSRPVPPAARLDRAAGDRLDPLHSALPIAHQGI